jgi:hypothetical protein
VKEKVKDGETEEERKEESRREKVQSTIPLAQPWIRRLPASPLDPSTLHFRESSSQTALPGAVLESPKMTPARVYAVIC